MCLHFVKLSFLCGKVTGTLSDQRSRFLGAKAVRLHKAWHACLAALHIRPSDKVEAHLFIEK